MMYDVEFNGHIVIEADTPDEACDKAQDIMDKSGAYVYIENAEVY
jgi:hypothetical protein